MSNIIIILQPADVAENVVVIILFTIINSLLLLHLIHIIIMIILMIILIIILTIVKFTCNSLILEASSHDAAFPPKSSNNQK